MAHEVETKDAVALTDAELTVMADLSQQAGAGWESGLLSKQMEEWVLVTQVFDGVDLAAFGFATLERIGGTPALLHGPSFVDRSDPAAALASLRRQQLHKARMAFPDEDVICSLRAVAPGSFAALTDLVDVRPWPDTRCNGEDRAWGRRLAKRFGAEDFDDRALIGRSDDDPLVFDVDLGSPNDAVGLWKTPLPTGSFRICWGWAMAEFLDGFADAG